MATVTELHKKLKKATEKRIKDKVAEFIVIDSNLRKEKKQEFKQGDNPDGSAIGQYKNKDYQSMKMRMNPLAGGDVDLILTGKFSNQMFVKSLGNSRFIFKSKDKKEDMLKEKYGEQIMGLNEETFLDAQYKRYVPKLVKYIKQITGLK